MKAKSAENQATWKEDDKQKKNLSLYRLIIGKEYASFLRKKET